MRLLQASRELLRHSSPCDPAIPVTPEKRALSAQRGLAGMSSRHDAQLIAARRVSADPYAAWLEQREAERAREALRLNPRAAWDDLRTPGFCAVGFH
jgi:hypothetical protein